MTQKETPALEMGIDALKRFPLDKQVPVVALKRKLPKSRLRVVRDVLFSSRIPIEDRPVDEYMWRVNPLRRDEWRAGKGGTMEFTGVDFLIAAHMGMYHGFLR